MVAIGGYNDNSPSDRLPDEKVQEEMILAGQAAVLLNQEDKGEGKTKEKMPFLWSFAFIFVILQGDSSNFFVCQSS